MKSNHNDGLLFDSLMVNSFGWAKDPNRYLRVDVEKTKAYHFDAAGDTEHAHTYYARAGDVAAAHYANAEAAMLYGKALALMPDRASAWSGSSCAAVRSSRTAAPRSPLRRRRSPA